MNFPGGRRSALPAKIGLVSPFGHEQLYCNQLALSSLFLSTSRLTLRCLPVSKPSVGGDHDIAIQLRCFEFSSRKLRPNKRQRTQLMF